MQRQLTTGTVKRPGPESIAQLFTLREAQLKFALDPRRIYLAVAQGDVHPVQPAGRILYPAWELEALVAGSDSTRATKVSRQQYAA